MTKKTMIIGLGPEYNYPGKFDDWLKSNTKYASNHGASLISRALSKQFDGEFVEIDEFSRIDELRDKFANCIIAFATHITVNRDVSVYADFIEKINIPTYAFSLGVQDYVPITGSIFKLHPSIKRLLEIVSDKSKFLGVRGHYTADILYKNGFKNVIPIGCPTIYWNLSSKLEILKPKEISKPAIVYHRTLAGDEGIHLLENIPLIGQDFLDEVVFTENLDNDIQLKMMELKQYQSFGDAEYIFDLIRKNGIFHYAWKEWFDYLKSRDFILGPRLHGCIGALIQGIPAVMLARDLRVNEIAEFFDIPFIPYKELKKKYSVQQIFNEADYSDFQISYTRRYNNYIKFLEKNGLVSNLDISTLPEDILYDSNDLRINLKISKVDAQKIYEVTEELYYFGKILRPFNRICKIFDIAIKKIIYKIKKYFSKMNTFSGTKSI